MLLHKVHVLLTSDRNWNKATGTFNSLAVFKSASKKPCKWNQSCWTTYICTQMSCYHSAWERERNIAVVTQTDRHTHVQTHIHMVHTYSHTHTHTQMLRHIYIVYIHTQGKRINYIHTQWSNPVAYASLPNMHIWFFQQLPTINLIQKLGAGG